MKFKNDNILTDNQEVQFGKHYLYTEYKSTELIYKVKIERFKYIVKVLEITENDTHFKFNCEIIEILKSKNVQTQIGSIFDFVINKSLRDTIWQLEDIAKGLPFPESYEYIGPKRIQDNISERYKGYEIKRKIDIENWINLTSQKVNRNGVIIATFVIDLRKKLLINDRHSEHVQCANGKNVLSAGEIGFVIDNNHVESISFISNQSTGYCPSSKSWINVKEAFNEINELDLPEYFDPEFIFSYCSSCQTLKIIKDNFYYCYRCEEELYSEIEFQKRRKYLNFQ